MTSVRRRVIRSERATSNARSSRRRERQQAQLAADRLALGRWMRRLRRACRSVEKLQARIQRREKQLAATS